MRIEGEGTKNTDRDDRLSVDRRGMEQAETMHATARDRAAAASAAASAAAAAAAASPAAAAAAAAVAAGSCCCSILAIAISTCDSEYLQQGKAEQSQARVPRPAPRARARGVWLHLRGGVRRTLKLRTSFKRPLETLFQRTVYMHYMQSDEKRSAYIQIDACIE